MAEQNALALTSMKEALTDKIRAMVMDMLPEDVIHKAIEEEYKLIVEGRVTQDQYGRGTTKHTPLLTQWIRDAIEPLTKKHVEESFQRWLDDPCNNEKVGTWINRAVKSAADARFLADVTMTVENVLAARMGTCTCGVAGLKNSQCPGCGGWIQ